jgi:hypothetical protein
MMDRGVVRAARYLGAKDAGQVDDRAATHDTPGVST